MHPWLGCQTSYFLRKLLTFFKPWLCTFRLNTKPDWKVHFSSRLQFLLKQQCARATKTQLPWCQGTKNRAQLAFTAWPRKPIIHLSALSISHWITGNVCQMHLNPDHSHSGQPCSFDCYTQPETNWMEEKGKDKKKQSASIYSLYGKECWLLQ